MTSTMDSSSGLRQAFKYCFAMNNVLMHVGASLCCVTVGVMRDEVGVIM